MGLDGGCFRCDGDVVAVSLLDFFKERLVATGEFEIQIIEDGLHHGGVDGSQFDWSAFGEAFGSMPFAVIIAEEQGFDREIKVRNQKARLFRKFDTSTGWNYSGNKLTLFRATLEPAA